MLSWICAKLSVDLILPAAAEGLDLSDPNVRLCFVNAKQTNF